MRAALGIALLLVLAVPGVEAREVASPRCGLVTEPACWAESFACYMATNESYQCVTPIAVASTASTCTNYGVVVMTSVLGHSSYCDGEGCRNYGIVVLVGDSSSCFGDADYLLYCIGSVCGCICWIEPMEAEVPR